MPYGVKSDIKISSQQDGKIQRRKEKQKRLILYEKSVAEYDKADREAERKKHEYLSTGFLPLDEREGRLVKAWSISDRESIDEVPVSRIMDASAAGNPILARKNAKAACPQVSSPVWTKPPHSPEATPP
jgi:hypothetical protein